MSDNNKHSAQHWDESSPVELRLLIEKEQASIQLLTATQELLKSLQQHIQELDHALQQAEQKDPQYLSKWLDSLELQTSNISYLVEAVDVLLKCTDESVFEHSETTIMNTIAHADKWLDTLTRIMNKIADRLKRIELNHDDFFKLTHQPKEPVRKVIKRIDNILQQMVEQPSEAQKIAALKHCLNPCLLESVSNAPSSISCPLHPTSRHSAAECKRIKLIRDSTQKPSKASTGQHHNGNNNNGSSSSSSSSSGHSVLQQAHLLQCKPRQPAALNSSQVQTSSSQQPASASSPPSSPSPSPASPPPGINQPSTNALDATAKQEFMEAVCHAWEIQGNIELAALDLNSLLHSGNASDSAADDSSLAVTPEAIHVEGLHADDNNIEDDCKDKVKPSITAPILLNHQHATAFIDSGASHSFISLAAVEKYLHPASCEHHHTIIFHINNMEIMLGDRSTTHITHCVAHVRINCGSCKLHHHFFIMLLQGEHEILFGRDIMRHISVGLFGLPVHYPLPSEQEEFKEDDSNMSDKDQCVELPPPPDITQKIAKGIRNVLQCNQQVPHGPSSTLPESVIYLNTGDAKPVFRKQYTIPQVYHDTCPCAILTQLPVEFSHPSSSQKGNSNPDLSTASGKTYLHMVWHTTQVHGHTFWCQPCSGCHVLNLSCTPYHVKFLRTPKLWPQSPDITGNILPDKVPPRALKPVDPDTPFEDKHYEMEKILDHDGPPSNHYYLVKWKGYPDSDNSWVAAKDFGSQRPISTY
ncbi:hypothetical protein QOT17_015576 [Balamuthia mandrillaris]